MFILELIVYLLDTLDRMRFIHFFFICVLFLGDRDWVKWTLWKDKESFYMLLETEYSRQIDCNWKQEEGYTGRVTTQICELIDQAERLRGADSRHPGQKRQKEKRERC